MKRILAMMIAVVAIGSLGVLPVMADPITLIDGGSITYSSTGGTPNLSASAKLSLSGGTLTIVLTNTSTADVLVPSDVLTALFLNISGSPILTPVSATLTNGSSVFYGSDGGGNLGGEWAYGSGSAVSSLRPGYNEGISSAGFGIFGASNFNGPDLESPAAVGGLNYGITSAGDNLSTGNNKVTGGTALTQNSVTFTLSGAGSSLIINNIGFQYGTSLSDPLLTPEPNSLVLLGSGMAALALLARKRGRAKNKHQ